MNNKIADRLRTEKMTPGLLRDALFCFDVTEIEEADNAMRMEDFR